MRVTCACFGAALGMAVIACHREVQPGGGLDDRAASASPQPSTAPSGSTRAATTIVATGEARLAANAPDANRSDDRDAGANKASLDADGAVEAHASDPANKSKPPLTSADLEERAAHLLDAVARNDPSAGDDFFFPKAPFIPLKDVGDPARYFDQLLATYHRDIRSLHAERKDWTGATFVSFELGTAPTWVAPGKEYNRIGYFRTFGGKLRYRVGDKNKEIVVSTIISWDGRWYVTHLSPIRH